MDEQRDGGDSFTTGNITDVQGMAMGRGASVKITGDKTSGGEKIDAAQLRAALEELFDVLGQQGLPREETRKAQTATGNALEGVMEEEVQGNKVVESVKKVGETLKQANVAVQEGSSLWQSIQKLASTLGPIVGGARVVAGWFGIPV